MSTTATTDHARLNAFVGAWVTGGELIAGPSASPAKFSARDSYEWLAGGYFLLHRFDADMPDGNIRGIEVIGYNPESKTYPMNSFDSQGNVNVMQARIEGSTWIFAGESIRFTGGFHDNGSIFAGLWELRSRDGSNWQPWMKVRLRRTDGNADALAGEIRD